MYYMQLKWHLLLCNINCNMLFLNNTKKRIARRNSPSLLVRARGGDELTVGKFLEETLSRGGGCGPSRFGLGLNSALKSALSNPSSNSCNSSSSSCSSSPSYCSRNTNLGTGTEKKEFEVCSLCNGLHQRHIKYT